jgi:hypothetical protein
LVSTDASTAGSPFVDISLANGVGSFTFYVQGVAGATGSPTVTASSTAFTAASATVAVVTWQLNFVNLPATAPAGGADTPFYLQTLVPGFGSEVVSPAGPLTVSLTSSNTGVASLTTASRTATSPVTVIIAPGSSSSAATVAAGGVTLHALSAGSTSIGVSASGAQSAAQQVTVQ